MSDIPAHWEVKPIKAIATLNDETLSESTDPDYQIEYVDISSVSLSAGIGSTEAMLFSSAPSRARRMVRDGDVLVSTVRTYLKAIAPVVAPAHNLIASTGFAVVRPMPGQCSGFLKYSLQSESFVHQVIGRSTGVSYPAINPSDLARIPLWSPPLPEQQAIAAFLDHETAKIDALIAEQEKLLALLAEKRQATISHAVTRGLDPSVPMKGSGIPWLGEVPAHWEVMALGRITTSKCDGPFGSGLKSDHYVDAGARVIRLQNIRGGRFDDRDAAFIDIGYFESEMARHAVNNGDLLIAGLGDDKNVVGRACVAPVDIYPALVKADCFRFQLDGDRAVAGFVAWALTVGAAYDAGILSSGSTRSRIPLTVMATRKIPLPPINEQIEISRHIEAVQTEFDQLMVAAQGAIKLLLDRRSALIAAAVTGQIDVRSEVEAQAA